MKNRILIRKLVIMMIIGMSGCVLMASGDWLMIYGDTAFEGELTWLTKGISEIPAWRNTYSMVISFPAVILYYIALCGMACFFKGSSDSKIYKILTAIGMTPWLCLHLLYTMIFYTFAQLNSAGEKELALSLCTDVFKHFSWIIMVGEVLMLLPFIYYIYATAANKTFLPRTMALNNPLLIYVILKAVTLILKDSPARLAFVNGLMSESMFLWFSVLALWIGIKKNNLLSSELKNDNQL